MGFFDLNIPYHESDRHAVDKSSLKGRRLKLALKAMELGYTGVAYNRTLKGVMSESDRCAIPHFPLSKLTACTSSSFFMAVKFHRELLNVAFSSPFRQYTRLTVIVDISSQASALNAGNPILKGYDIVAVRPMNQNAFDQACQTAEVDMIAIDFSEKLQFRLKQPMVKAAIKRGVYFEITYCGLIADAQTRRQMISNCKLLVDWTRGKNLIISSGAPSVTEFRGPQDVANLLSLLGLPIERAKAAIAKNCRSLLVNASRKKQFYKEAVKVEEIPSGGQQSALFDDWLKWDPISSGEGDMLLDDMEKSFAASNTQTETAKTMNFVSSMNGLPAHGLQIKDLISVTKTALEPPETNNFECVAMEIDKALVPAVENLEQSCLSENQCSASNLSKEQGGVLGQISSSDVENIYLPPGCQVPKVSLDYVPEEGQTSVNDAKIGHQDSGFEHSAIHNSTSNCEETIPISSENPNCSNIVASELQSPLQVFVGNDLHDGGGAVIEMETPITDGHVLAEFSNPSIESNFPAFTLEESNVENQCFPVDMVPNKIDRENKQELHVASFDAPAQDAYVEGEQYCEMTDSPVKLRDKSSDEGVLNLEADVNEPIYNDVIGERKQIDPVINYRRIGKSQAGKDRRKRNSPHRPILFPFKRFLKLRLRKSGK